MALAPVIVTSHRVPLASPCHGGSVSVPIPMRSASMMRCSSARLSERANRSCQTGAEARHGVYTFGEPKQPKQSRLASPHRAVGPDGRGFRLLARIPTRTQTAT